VNRSSSPLFLRLSVGLGLATAAATSLIRADGALPQHPATHSPASSSSGHQVFAGPAPRPVGDGAPAPRPAGTTAARAPMDDTVVTSPDGDAGSTPIFAATDAFLERAATPVFEQTTVHRGSQPAAHRHAGSSARVASGQVPRPRSGRHAAGPPSGSSGSSRHHHHPGGGRHAAASGRHA
jgi:hypothetical protein